MDHKRECLTGDARTSDLVRCSNNCHRASRLRLQNDDIQSCREINAPFSNSVSNPQTSKVLLLSGLATTAALTLSSLGERVLTCATEEWAGVAFSNGKRAPWRMSESGRRTGRLRTFSMSRVITESRSPAT